MNNRIKELISNTFLFTLANMGSKVLVFLMVPLYTSVLSTEEYGISDLVQTTALLLFPLLALKSSEAVLRFSFQEDYSKDDLLSIGIRITLIGSFISVLLAIIFRFIPLFDTVGNFVFFIPFMYTLHGLCDLMHKYSRGVDKVKVSAFAGFINTIFVIIFNLLFLVVFRIGILGYLLSFCISDLITFIYMFWHCSAFDQIKFRINKSIQNEMLKFSLPLVPNSLSWWVLGSLNKYFLLAYVGVSSVGIYSATLRIPTILTVLSDIFAQAWLLSALKNYGSEESRNFIRSMHIRFFSALVFLTSLIILLSHPLVNILLTGSFSSYWYIVPVMFISVFFGSLVGFLGTIFSAERKNTMQFISTMVGSFVSVVSTILLIRYFGVLGVALSTLIGYFVIWLMRRIAVNKYIDVGIGLSFSIVQFIILLLEAYFVGTEFYLGASICLLVLIGLNIKPLLDIILFVFRETISYRIKH